MVSPWLLVFALISLSFLFLKRSKGSRPPGPRPLPLLGNILQIPTSYLWVRFTEWALLYGEITYVEALGQSILVLNSLKAAKELLDNRSSIYSGRPYVPMIDLCTFDRFFPLATYGDEWRAQRKMVSFALSNSMLPSYRPLKEQEAKRLVSSVLENPNQLFPQVKLRIASIITRVSYGCYPESIDDPIIAVPMNAIEEGGKTVEMTWLVNILPSLRHLPQWFPGTEFLRVAKHHSDTFNYAMWNPYQVCKKNIENGTALQPNLCEIILSEAGGTLSAEDESHLVYGLGGVFIGGLDTSMTVTLAFFLYMVRHPEIQEKARQEIDRVIGRDCLPTISDSGKLPYTRSILMEALRMCPPVPTGIPHCSTADDIYNGYFIPKGTTIFANIHYLLRDPELFENPDVFNPDRYNLLDTEMDKVIDIAFGFGRRRCPGVGFAEETMFSIIATTLATCLILPQVDENGVDIIPELKLDSGIAPFPVEFKCRLVCRSEATRELLAPTGVMC